VSPRLPLKGDSLPALGALATGMPLLSPLRASDRDVGGASALASMRVPPALSAPPTAPPTAWLFHPPSAAVAGSTSHRRDGVGGTIVPVHTADAADHSLLLRSLVSPPSNHRRVP
jgi:hypothetical protein